MRYLPTENHRASARASVVCEALPAMARGASGEGGEEESKVIDPRLQAAYDGIAEYIGDTIDPSQLLIAAKCRALAYGYHARWKDAPYVVLDVEQTVESDLWNPETGRKSRSFRVAGRLDLRAMNRDRRVLFDHKTTSDDIADPAGTYWRQLVVEGQPSHYMLLEWLNGRKVDDAVWDVMRKPGISPKALAKADAKLAIMSHEYCGRALSDESLLSLQADGRETLEMYEARLADDCTKGRPEHYFQRRSVPRLDSEIHEYAVELWEHSQEMLHVLRLDRRARTPGACMAYNRPCEFLGLCSGFDTPDSDKWRRKQRVHTELPLEGDGRDVITHSRIGCFQLCRRKHYYKYILGIEHVEEELDARWFGSCWHAALNAYFTKQKEMYGNSTTDAPAAAVGIAANETPQYL